MTLFSRARGTLHSIPECLAFAIRSGHQKNLWRVLRRVPSDPRRRTDLFQQAHAMFPKGLLFLSIFQSRQGQQARHFIQPATVQIILPLGQERVIRGRHQALHEQVGHGADLVRRRHDVKVVARHERGIGGGFVQEHHSQPARVVLAQRRLTVT
jgi:hypothetical protein